MKIELRAHYKLLGYRLLKVLQKDFDATLNNKLASGEYGRMDLPRGYNARFMRWSGPRKPYYIIIFNELHKYKLELDLTAIQIIDNRYIWFLGRRTNDVIRKLIESKFDFIDKLPAAYIDAVRSTKNQLNAGKQVQRSGYRVCEDVDESGLKEQFSYLVAEVLSTYWGYEIKDRKKTDTYTIDDKRAVEGYERDRVITSYSRNKKLVAECKKRNNNECEVCNFHLIIDGIPVIECHHVDPVHRGIRVTRPEDLVCLCPTCHRIAHQREFPYSVQEIINLRTMAA